MEKSIGGWWIVLECLFSHLYSSLTQFLGAARKFNWLGETQVAWCCALLYSKGCTLTYLPATRAMDEGRTVVQLHSAANNGTQDYTEYTYYTFCVPGTLFREQSLGNSTFYW